jgi:hypothetical protein
MPVLVPVSKVGTGNGHCHETHCHHQQEQQQRRLELSRITSISGWKGGIVNPLTFGTRVLAVSPTGNSNLDLTADAAAVLTTTLLDSPLNVQQTLLTQPGTMLRLVSSTFPNRFQASDLAEAAVLGGCRLSVLLQRAVLQYGQWFSSPAWALALETVACAMCLIIFLAVDVCCLVLLVSYGLADLVADLTPPAAAAAAAAAFGTGWYSGSFRSLLPSSTAPTG